MKRSKFLVVTFGNLIAGYFLFSWGWFKKFNDQKDTNMPTLNLRDSGNFLSRCSSFMNAQGKDPNLEGDAWIRDYNDTSISDSVYNANVTTFNGYFDAWLNGTLVLTANSGGTYQPPVGSAPPRVTPRPRTP